MRLVLLAGLLAPAPLLAADEPPKPAADKPICRRSEPEVGSLMAGKRICHTAAEWAAINAEAARHQTLPAGMPAMNREPMVTR